MANDDSRNQRTWVSLELTSLGMQKAEEGSLADSLRRDLCAAPDFPIFVPCITQQREGREIVINVIEGYAFAASGLLESQYLSLEKKNLVRQVLTVRGQGGVRVLATIPDHQIQEMVEKFREMVHTSVSVGDNVRLCSGKYAKLEGQVIDIIDDGTVLVQIKMRSLDIITVVTRTMLQAPGEPEMSVEDEDVDGSTEYGSF